MPRHVLDDRSPDLPPSASIAPSADVIGAVRVGEGAGIWFGAVVRADNGVIAIGARTNVQDAATLHSDAEAP